MFDALQFKRNKIMNAIYICDIPLIIHQKRSTIEHTK